MANEARKQKLSGLLSWARGEQQEQQQAPAAPSSKRKNPYELLQGMSAKPSASKPYTPLVGAVGQAMNFFTSKGYTRQQAAGIVGNLVVESGNFDPNVIAGKRRGDQGKAFGVAQWHPDRQQRFRKAFGRDIIGTSLTEQLEFIHWELSNDEKSAGDKLRRARTPQEAAEVFDIHYERSSGQHRQRRVKEAVRLFGM